MEQATIILGSTSRYRSELLGRLQIPFVQAAPDCEEIQAPHESPLAMARRLAEAKARSVTQTAYPQFVVIGSDQVAHVDGIILPKPGDMERATRQLTMSSGRWVTFTTALALVDHEKRCTVAAESYQVRFRSLAPEQIRRYLQRERPFDCAGSLKAESLGVTLLENARGRDITALYGLPLMLLREQLLLHNIDITDFNYER